MSYRYGAGVLLALIGAAGLAGYGYFLYGPEDHSRQLIALGMPGDLLLAGAFILMLLGGLGLIFERRSRGRRR